MSTAGQTERRSILGKNVNRSRINGSTLLTSYVVARDFSVVGLSAAEAVLEVSWGIDRPLPQVWETFKDFNLWENQHGYFWDGVVGDEEGNFVFMSDQVSSYGVGIAYAVRKVIPQQLIYLESLPMAYGEGGTGSWSGHNLMSLSGSDVRTQIEVYMEHTWLSRQANVETLIGVAQSALTGAVGFWRDSFIPRLEEIVGARQGR